MSAMYVCMCYVCDVCPVPPAPRPRANAYSYCGTTTCRARGDRVVGGSMQLASRASRTRSPSHSPRALTHAAATWPAVPPTSDDASGLIVDWKFITPGWLLFRPELAGSKDWGAAGMVAGARITMAAVGWLVGWIRQSLIGRHAEAVARLNCRTSEMVILTNLGIYLL